MKKTFESILNLFNLKEKTNQMTIAELNAFNLRKEKIEKGKRSRAYISEINQKYNNMKKIEMNSLRKSS